MLKRSSLLSITNHEQQNLIKSSHQRSKSKREIISQKINGWLDDKPLLQHNINTIKYIPNYYEEILDEKRYRTTHCGYENKIIQRRKMEIKQQQNTIIQINQQSEEQKNQQSPEHINYQYSHIELLKFQAKHLENDQITHHKFPTFSGLNQTHLVMNVPKQNNYLTNTEIDNIRRKIRTESTKKRKVQSYLYRNMKKDPTNDSDNDRPSATTTIQANYRFYRTLHNYQMKSSIQNQIVPNKTKKSTHMMIQIPGMRINQSSFFDQIKNSESYKEGRELGSKSVWKGCHTGVDKKQNEGEEWKTIHWKKNRPFSKYFQYKKNVKKRPCSQYQCKRDKRDNNLTLIEGRRLYQLRTYQLDKICDQQLKNG